MITIAIATLVILAALAPLVHRVLRGWSGVFFGACSAGVGGLFLSIAPGVLGGEAYTQSWDWVEPLGVNLSFRVDGLALMFALLIGFIGGLVLMYTSSYLKGYDRQGFFYAVLLAFMASMLGLVVADNLIMLFVFWELTSVTSFLLIGFSHEKASARRAAVQALLVTGLGGLVLLAGLIMLGLEAGGFELSALKNADLVSSPLYVPIVVCVLVGCFSKSAILPFHFWLPNAMEAPSPVSALLHSSTMVKAGVYLVARLHPDLSGTALWNDTLVVFGGATMLFAAIAATRKSTLKGVLAYSTVSSLGLLVMFIGLDAAKAAVAYLLAHAMFKACLFLVAGSVAKATGVKDPAKLAGLFRVMPALGVASLLGALSFAGMFPFAGFVGKELAIKASLGHPEWATYATVMTVAGAVFTVMAALIVGVGPLFGKAQQDLSDIKRPDWRQWGGPLLLAIAGVVVALFPDTIKPLVLATMESIKGKPYDGEVKLSAIKLLIPPTTATWVSIGVLVGGTLLYLGRNVYFRVTRTPAWGAPLTADNGYDLFLKGLARTTVFVTRFIQSGYLHYYVRATLVATVAIVASAISRAEEIKPVFESFTLIDAIIAFAIVSCSLVVLFISNALAAIAVLGGVGFLLALLFILYGLPDVAMTALAVETLIVIIFVLVIYNLRPLRNLTSTPRRLFDAGFALAFGAVMWALATVAVNVEPIAPISDLHAELSYTGGKGRNVVNVILVDFRAMDTLGEIFVLGIAAIGVYTLLKRDRGETA